MHRIPAKDRQSTLSAIKQWECIVPAGSSFTPTRAALLVCSMFDLDPAGVGGQTVSAILVRDYGWIKDARLITKPMQQSTT